MALKKINGNGESKSISQYKLRKFLDLKEKAAEFDKLKKEIISDIRGGVSIQKGPLAATINITKYSSVKWKDECIKAVGVAEVERILAGAPKNSERCSLIVVDRDNPISE